MKEGEWKWKAAKDKRIKGEKEERKTVQERMYAKGKNENTKHQ